MGRGSVGPGRRDTGVVWTRFALVALLPIALAGCGGGGGTAAPAAQTTTTAVPAAKPKALTIKVTSVVSVTKSHDNPPKGTSPGDKVEFTDRLLNTVPQFGRDTNEQVGTDEGTMTFTGAHTARLDGEASLPDGTITFGGQVTVVSPTSIAVPVTGGTGKYQHASGTLLVGSGEKRAANTYKLVIDSVPGPVA
jgi:hypothetical protein